jgi:hypothetical protein
VRIGDMQPTTGGTDGEASDTKPFGYAACSANSRPLRRRKLRRENPEAMKFAVDSKSLNGSVLIPNIRGAACSP